MPVNGPPVMLPLHLLLKMSYSFNNNNKKKTPTLILFIYLFIYFLRSHSRWSSRLSREKRCSGSFLSGGMTGYSRRISSRSGGKAWSSSSISKLRPQPDLHHSWGGGLLFKRVPSSRNFKFLFFFLNQKLVPCCWWNFISREQKKNQPLPAVKEYPICQRLTGLFSHYIFIFFGN